MPLRPKPLARHVLVTLLALFAAGCATGYGRRGVTGGYSDTRIDDTHYLVSFDGNGHTSKDRVWYFWFYRCAELTVEKGYAYFDLEPAKKGEKQGALEDPPSPNRRLARRAPDAGGLVVPAGYYYYTTTVTTWHSSAVVVMFPTVPAGKILFSAKRVLELLGPFVHANETPPERKKLFRGAAMKLGPQQEPVQVVPDGVTVGYVDMEKVLSGVSEGKAALARLKASAAKKQADVEGRKAELDLLRKSADGETNARQRAKLEAELAAKKKQLQELTTRYVADLNAERKRAFGAITDRVGPIVERVRAAQHLDTVTEKDAGGLWDVDLTGEVIRQYEEKYPVAGAT